MEVAMEANLCYGPLSAPQVPASEDRRPPATQEAEQNMAHYETISH